MGAGSEKFLKTILIIFNVIFAIGGLISLISGGVALGAIRAGTSGLNIESDDHSLTGAAGLLIAIGCFVFITAVLGCIAAVRENRIALIVYAVILVFILILQFAAAITAFALRGKLQDFVHKQLSTLRDSIRNDTTTTGLGRYGTAFKMFQEQWKCCGVDGPADWMQINWFKKKYTTLAKTYNVTFPGCCYGESSVCKPCGNSTTYDCVAVDKKLVDTSIYTVGCSTGWTEFMQRNVGIVAGVALTFGLIQILGIVIACCLARSLTGGHERIN